MGMIPTEWTTVRHSRKIGGYFNQQENNTPLFNPMLLL